MEIRWLHPRMPEAEIKLFLNLGYKMVYPASSQEELEESEEFEDGYYTSLGNALSQAFPCVILKNEKRILIIEL